MKVMLHPRARAHMIANALCYVAYGSSLAFGPESWWPRGTYQFVYSLGGRFWWGVSMTAIGLFAAWAIQGKVFLAARRWGLAALSAYSAVFCAGFVINVVLNGGPVGAPTTWALITAMHFIEAGRPVYYVEGAHD